MIGYMFIYGGGVVKFFFQCWVDLGVGLKIVVQVCCIVYFFLLCFGNGFIY